MEFKQYKIDQTLVHHAMGEKEGTFQSSSPPFSHDSLFGELADWKEVTRFKNTHHSLPTCSLGTLLQLQSGAPLFQEPRLRQRSGSGDGEDLVSASLL